jgi:hypothetical protein
MPGIDKQYATNSYDLLKNAYGDKIPVSEEDFYTKIENDVDGNYRRNIYNLLQNKYGEDVSKVSIEDYSKKFFSEGEDPFVKDQEPPTVTESKLEGIDSAIEKAKTQKELADQDKDIELAPEEWLQANNVGTGLYRKSKEKELSKKYWEEQFDLLNQHKVRTERAIETKTKVDNLRPTEVEEIQNKSSEELLSKGYDPNTVGYVKREKYFNEQRTGIDSIIKSTTDPNYQLSLYNYSNNQTDLTKLDPGITKFLGDSSFNEMNSYKDRVEFLEKEADQYVINNSKIDDSEEVKNKIKKDFYNKINPYILFDSDGTPSMFAIQNMSHILDDRINSQINILKKDLGSLNNEKYSDLKEQRDKYRNISSIDPNVQLAHSNSHKNDSQIKNLSDKINDLQRTKDILKQTLRKPLAKGSFGTGLKDIDWEDQATLGIKSIIETVDFFNINQKYSRGEELTPEEQSVVDAVGMMNYVQGKSQAGYGHKIGQGVAQMPAYMVGFALASPAYSGVKTAVQKQVGKVIKKEVKKKAIGQLGQWLAHKAIPGAVATMPSTLINPSTSVLENTTQKMTEVAQIAFTDEVDDIHAKFIPGTDEKISRALFEGATEAYTENLFERSGTALLKGLGYPVKGLTGKLKGTKLYQKLLIGEYARLKGLKPKTLGFKNKLTKTLETAGFNGMVEEMFEEYGTNIANGILLGEDMGFDLETFVTTLGTVAVWGGALGTVNKASYSISGNSVQATYKDIEGKEQSIKIPKDTYTSLIELEKKDGPISEVDIQKVIKDGKLSGKQTGFVLKWWMKENVKGMVQEAKKQAKKPEEKAPKKEKKEKKKVKVDDSVKRNEFDDLSELESIDLEEATEEKSTKIKGQIDETISDIKKKYHDDTAQTDEQITFDQIGEGANITVQRKVGKETVNIPAETIGIEKDFVRVKYKNGVEDIILKDTDFKLFSNEKEIEDDREFLNKENEGKRGFEVTKLSDGKNVYTKKVDIEDEKGIYRMFRNEDGTWEIVNEKGEVQEFDKPTNAKVQKNVINAFKESKIEKIKSSKEKVSEIERKRKGAIENIKFIDSDEASGNIVYESEFEGDKFSEVGNKQDIIDAINEKYDIDLGKKEKRKSEREEGSLFDELDKSVFEKPTDYKKIAEESKKAVEEFEKKQVGELKPTKKKGKVIYSTSGTGKTTLAKEQPDKYVDADVLISDEFKRMEKEGEFDSLPQEAKDIIKKLDPDSKTFSSDISKIFEHEFAQGKSYNNTTAKEVYDNVRKGFKAITDSGKNVLTGSSTFLDVSDEVFTEEKEVVEKRKGKDLTKAIKKEQERISKFKRTPVKLEGRTIEEARKIDEEKVEKPTQKKIDFEKLEKEQKSKLESFAKLQIKNLEAKREAKKGTLQSGIPFVDETTAILFWRGVEKFAQGVKSLQELIDKINKWIKETTDYPQEELDKIYSQIDTMLESRDEMIVQFKELFESEKPYYEATEAIAMSIEEKVNAHRKAFSSIFKNVADQTGQDKRALEKKFYEVMQEGLFDDLKNEDDFKNALKNAKDKYSQYKELFDEIELHWDYPRAVSLMNFYRNVRLIEQYGFVFTKDGVKFKSLNSEDSTNDLSKKFNSHINNITFRTNEDKLIDDPNNAIKAILVDYRNDLENIRKSSNSEKKHEKFDRQLQLLSDFTGIDKSVWKGYFVPLTNETDVYIKKQDSKGQEKFEKVTFKDYDSLLSYDPSILNDGKYDDVGIVSGNKLEGDYIDNNVYYYDKVKNEYLVKKNPAIVNKLTKIIDQSTVRNIKNNVVNFFTKGDETKDVYSNIRKLASTITKSGSISVEGVDVQSNRFNSFIMMSHLQNAAENIHKSKLDNELAKMYQDENVPMKISIINGISNNKINKQSKSDKITEGEYWLSQMLMFANVEDGKYKGVLGQFGDKKTMYVSDVKHYDKIDMNEISDQFSDLDKVREMFSKVMTKGIRNGAFQGMNKSDRVKFIDNFIYNYVKNIADIHEIFHGELIKDNYENLVELVKRAGSTNSTGYRLDQSIDGGVGKKFRFVSAWDNKIADELGLAEDQFDGILFYSGNMGERLSVSMGDMYNKKNEYDGPLSSVKALFSTQKNKKRGLTKTNWVNIDVISEAYKDIKDHYSHKLKEFIDEHELDALSFDSGTKKLEKKSHLVLFDKNGNIRDIDAKEMEDHAFDRSTQDIYIQQELRHTSELKRGKQSTQLMANILPLQHAPEMVNQMNDQVKKTLQDLDDKLSELDNTKAKLDFLAEQLETQDQPELQRLVELGVTLHDAGYRNMMQSILSSYFAKKGLEKLSNRVATQELPADPSLKELRKTEDGKHTLLPQVDVGIEGIRYEQKFESQQKSLDHYNKNKEKYSDLKEWEIEDGIIPGDVVLSTRVPADDLHSHPIGRARHKLSGNFTVLDKESQARSGSDFDGDQRFNQTLFRNKNGNVIRKGIEGNANKFLESLVEDYHNPENFDRIRHAIDTKFFDPIIPKNKAKYSFTDPQGLTDSRKNNIVGVVMKGVLSDMSVMSALIANHNIKPKKSIKIHKNLYTSQFAKDTDGSLRNAIGILQNLAFDNAKDPKIEALGLNEITAQMFILLMISDPRIDTAENKDQFILDKVKVISEYMNSPLLQKFITAKRESNGVLSDKKDKDIFAELTMEYIDGYTASGIPRSSEVEALKSLYYSANDLGELKKYYALTKSFPNNAVELLQALNVVDSFTQNDMQYLDVSGIKDSKIKTFELIEESVRFATNKVFNHTLELSVSGQEIFRHFVESKKKKVKAKNVTLSNKEIDAISRSLNLIVAIDAINSQIEWKNNKPLGLKDFEKGLYDKLPIYRARFEGNKFLNAIQRSGAKNNFTIKLADDYNFAKLPESELEAIRNDFAKLPEGAKHSFALYSMQKYGLGSSTFKGNFFTLFDLDYRVEMSKLITNEADKWINGFIEDSKLANTIKWVARLNEGVLGEYIKPPKVIGSFKDSYDINLDPSYEISNEVLKEISDLLTNNELNKSDTKETKKEKFDEIFKREGVDQVAFIRYFKKTQKIKGEGFTISQYVQEILQNREQKMNLEKPVDIYNLVQKYKPCKFK